MKRQPIETFRRQGRGGKGVRGANLKEEDVISDVFTTTTHHWLLFFTSKGKVYRVKVHEVPEAVAHGARDVRREPARACRSRATRRSQAVIDLKEYEDGPVPAVRDAARAW